MSNPGPVLCPYCRTRRRRRRLTHCGDAACRAAASERRRQQMALRRRAGQLGHNLGRRPAVAAEIREANERQIIRQIERVAAEQAALRAAGLDPVSCSAIAADRVLKKAQMTKFKHSG